MKRFSDSIREPEYEIQIGLLFLKILGQFLESQTDEILKDSLNRRNLKDI